MEECGELHSSPSAIQQREWKMSDYPKKTVRTAGRDLACGYEEYTASSSIL